MFDAAISGLAADLVDRLRASGLLMATAESCTSGLIVTHGAVSERVAAAMASGALASSLADITVAVTGVAGPGGGSADKPVGLVWFGFARRGGSVWTECQIFPGDRIAVRAATVGWALKQVRNSISG